MLFVFIYADVSLKPSNWVKYPQGTYRS